MAIVARKLKDGRTHYYAVVTVAGTKRWIDAGFDKPRVAKQIEAELMTKARKNELPAAMRDLKFSVLADRYLKDGTHHLREQSITTYKSRLDTHLLPFFGDKKVRGQIDAQLIGSWMSWERNHKGTSDKTIKRCLVTLSAVLSYAVAINLVTDNPCGRVKAPKVNDGGVDYTLSEAQTAALIANTVKSERPLMSFLCCTGCRPSEAAELRWGDINWRDSLVINRRTATSRGANDTKNSKVRAVPLVPELMTELREQHKRVANNKDDLVFVTTRGQRHQMQRWARDVLRPSLNRAGLAVPAGSDRNYITRKSFITQWLSRGESVALVSEIVGASPATLLKHYAKHRTEDAVAAMQRMSASMSASSSDATGNIAQSA